MEYEVTRSVSEKPYCERERVQSTARFSCNYRHCAPVVCFGDRFHVLLRLVPTGGGGKRRFTTDCQSSYSESNHRTRNSGGSGGELRRALHSLFSNKSNPLLLEKSTSFEEGKAMALTRSKVRALVPKLSYNESDDAKQDEETKAETSNFHEVVDISPESRVVISNHFRYFLFTPYMGPGVASPTWNMPDN